MFFLAFLRTNQYLTVLLTTLRKTPLYIPALFFFTVLFFPFVGLVPYLDGDTEFLIAVNFYLGKYLTNWMPYHPPLKLFLTYILFHIFGFYAYSFLGYIFGIFGIIAIYSIATSLFDKRTAILSAMLLGLSGIYISSAVFSLNDFLLTVFILFSFAFYVKEKYLWAILMSCFAVMSKESAIIFPISIIIVELCNKQWRWINLFPFITLLAWVIFLHFTGHELWNSWNFSNSRPAGSFFTVINNIMSGNILNKYAYENWLHVFIFNFNWILWLFAAFAILKTKWNRYKAIIILFCGLYSLIILSFQTYSITRYILPILPLVYMFVGVALTKIKFHYLTIPFIFSIMLFSLFASIDPISNMIWPTKWQILNQSFYVNRALDGDDGITYNMQFLYLTKERTALITTGNCQMYIATLSIYPDTLKTLKIPQCDK